MCECVLRLRGASPGPLPEGAPSWLPSRAQAEACAGAWTAPAEEICLRAAAEGYAEERERDHTPLRGLPEGQATVMEVGHTPLRGSPEGQAALEGRDHTPLSAPAYSLYRHSQRVDSLCAPSFGQGSSGVPPYARGHRPPLLCASNLCRGSSRFASCSDGRGWLRAHSALLLLVLLWALAGGGAHGQQTVGLVGRLEQELHKDLQAQRSLPAGTSRAYQGAPRDTIQWQRFTNYSQAGFVHYSSYRLGETRVVVLGLCFRTGLRLNWEEGGATVRGNVSCSWNDMALGTVSRGRVELRTTGEPHWEANFTYDGCFLFCTYQKNKTELLPHDHEAFVGSVGRGGYLEVGVGPQKFIAYTEEEPVKVLPADHFKRLAHQIVFCSAPLFGTLEPRALSQWMDYHLFLLGLDHMFLYDAGGLVPRVLAELARFRDAGLITVTDFRDQALYSSWSHAQAVAQYDCLFRNRETADWVGFGDFDEYMVDHFPRPRTFRGFLCEQTGWGVAYLSYGNFEFARECNETNLWDPSLGRFAVEFPQKRARYATCVPGERKHPNDCQGRRKFFANPRRVERVYIHSARATSGSVRRGHHLRVHGHVFYNHYRGITAQGQWCAVPGLPPPRWERHNDEAWTDLTRNLVHAASAVRIAAAARQCLQRQSVPTHFCRQEHGEETLPQWRFRELLDASFVFFSAYRVDERRVALLGLAPKGGMLGGLEGPDVPCKPETRLTCAVKRDGLVVAEGQLTKVSRRNQTYDYSTVLLFCDLPPWVTASFWADNGTALAPASAPASSANGSPSGGAAGAAEARGSSGGRLWVVVGLGRGDYRPLPPPLAPSSAAAAPPSSAAPSPKAASPVVPGASLPTLVFCAAPLQAGGAGARGVSDWLDYHLFHLGLDHLFLYDAGGLGEGGAAAPLVRRFVDAGRLTVVEFGDQMLFPAENDAQDLALHDCLYRNRGRAKWVAWGSLEEYWEDRTQPKGSLRDHLSGLDQTRTSHAVFTITTYASSFANSTDTSSLNCSEGNQGGTPGAPQGVPGNDTHRSAGDQAPLVEAFGRSFLRDVSACGGDQEATGSSTAQGEGSTLNPASDKCPWAQGLVLNPNLVEVADVQKFNVSASEGSVVTLDPTSQLHVTRYRGLLQAAGTPCLGQRRGGPGDPQSGQLGGGGGDSAAAQDTAKGGDGEGERGSPPEGVLKIARAARACAAEALVPTWQCLRP